MTMAMPAREAAILADRIEAAAFVDLFAAAPAALVARLGLTVKSVAGATALFAPGLQTTMFNRVIGLGLDRPASAADLDALRQDYAGTGHPNWWLHWNPHAAPADGAEWLVAQGFTLPARRSWAKMLRGTALPPAVQTTLHVASAATAQVAATAACIAQAFGMPPLMGDWLAALHTRAQWRIYALADGADIVGGACLYIDSVAGQRTGWLGMGAVLASHRRRSGQAAAMALRISDAVAAGCRWVATETGEAIGDEANPSLSNMRRMGFGRIASRLNFEAAAQ